MRERLAATQGGCLYLDSPDDLPQLLQHRLARQFQSDRRKASTASDRKDSRCRLILGFRPDVESGPQEIAVEASGAALSISLPGLGERADAITPLAESYLKWFSGRQGHESSGFSRQTIDRIHGYEWPGNVCELVGLCTRRYAGPRTA